MTLNIWGFLTSLLNRSDIESCQCAHAHAAHQHHRSGAQCVQCGCDQYRARSLHASRSGNGGLRG